MRRLLRFVPLLCLASWACAADRETPAATEMEADSMVLFETDSETVAIRDVAADPSGGVWAIGTTTPFGHRYSADGKLVQRFGRQGDGPGELRSPWAVLPTGRADHPVEIFDQATSTLVAYDALLHEVERRELTTHRPAFSALERHTFGQMQWLERNGSGYLFLEQPDGIIASRSIRRSVLLRLDSVAASVDTLADLRNAEPPVELRTRPLEMIDLPLAASCVDGRALLLQTTARVLHRYARSGESDGREVLPLSTRPMTDEDLRPWLRPYFGRMIQLATSAAPEGAAASEEIIDRALREQRDWFGAEIPAAVGLLCDALGRAWIQEFSTADDPGGRGRRWRVFEGARHVRTVVLPRGFRPFEFAGGEGDALVGVHTDGLGRERVARVVLPEEAR